MTAREIHLAVFTLACTAAFAYSRGGGLAWTLLVPCLLAWRFPITNVPGRARQPVEWASWLALVLVGGVVFKWLASPEGQGQPAPPLPAPSGYALALVAAVFLSGRTIWRPARALLPACVGLLILAFSQKALPMVFPAVGLAAVGLLAGSGTARRLPRLALCGLGVATLAYGIARLLPWAQPQVVQAVARAAFPEMTSGFSLEARLGGSGELTLSRRLALRVWTDRPQRLRGQVATRFDGVSWHSAPGSTPAAAAPSLENGLGSWLGEIPGATFLAPGRDAQQAHAPTATRTRVLPVLALSALMTPAGVIFLRAPLAPARFDSYEMPGPTLAEGTMYGVVSDARNEGRGPTADVLEVLGDTDPRLRELARRLAAGAPDAEARIASTVGFLQSECRYSLRPGPFRSGQPVAEFLFEKKQGWCQYFASAAAVLLRLQGVPTRYVSGFNVRSSLLRGGHYLVRESDAHAWIDAYVPGQGWVEVDPTPPAAYETAHGQPEQGRASEILERLRGLLARIRGTDWAAIPRLLWGEIREVAPWLAVVLLVAAATVLGLRLARRYRRRRSALTLLRAESPPHLTTLLASLDRAWARLGTARPPARALAEHLDALRPGQLTPEVLEASRAVVERYYRCRFGGVETSAEEIRGLEAMVEGWGRRG